MGIDIYYYSKNERIKVEDHLWTITDREVEHLKNIFTIFKNCTGYKIDEYGDLVLSVGALSNFYKVILTNMPINNDAEQKKIQFKLKKVIENAIKTNRQLAFYGD